MSQLNVFKASAGSGKTWRLAVEYLKILLGRPDAYRQVLAVTFTNKATAEMKERILNDLYDISMYKPGDPIGPVLQSLCKEMSPPGEDLASQAYTLMERAKTALRCLLHDYSHFRIETIDSFFQSVLHNLARELGVNSGFNISLEQDSVLDTAVDKLVEQADQDKDLLNWIENYLRENIDNGKNRNIQRKLKEFGKDIFQESFQAKEAVLTQQLSNKKFLQGYREKLNEIKDACEKNIKEAVKCFYDKIALHHLDINDFFKQSKGPAGYIVQLNNGNYEKGLFDRTSAVDALDNPENWSSKTHSRREEIIRLGEKELNPLLKKIEQIRSENYRHICSCKKSLEHLNELGLLTDISKEVRRINNEENRFLLSDTMALLRGLIGHNDASFVFEKIGSELHHIMIDEFQDTSRLQWENFKPLLTETLSNGYSNLLVGDEKQSIYRFRNGDWRILSNIDKAFPSANTQIHPLTYNYRSEKNIIEFNNRFFQAAIPELSDFLRTSTGIQEPYLEKAYGSIHQDWPRSETETAKGTVEIRLLEEKKDYNENTLAALLRLTEDLQKEGVAPHQMAILIRKNKYIPMIADYFVAYRSDHPESPYCYDIISDEAFQLKSSSAVNILIAALSVIDNPSDKIAQEKLGQFLLQEKDICSSWTKLIPKPENPTELFPAAFSQHLEELSQLPLYELIEHLCRIFRMDLFSQQESYLFFFMDQIREAIDRNCSDLHAFLALWEEKLCTLTIPAGDNPNGIRILSVHKSKGLQYHTVILPFCDWNIGSEINSFKIWCEPQEAPYNELGLIPVSYQKDLRNSVFSSYYYEELFQSAIDSINMLYVALTRAEKNLFVFGKMPKFGEKTSYSCISDLIYSVLQKDDFLKEYLVENASSHDTKTTEASLSSKKNKKQTEAPESMLFRYGHLYTQTKPQKNAEPAMQNIHVPFLCHGQRTGFRQSNRSKDFVREQSSEYSNEYIDRGKLLHLIFSKMRVASDLDAALRSLLSEGVLQVGQVDELRQYIRQALQHPQAQAWYSDKARLFNECVILYRDKNGKLQEKRPDRVILRDNEVQIIDFKFGKPASRYRRQVAEYMQLLRQMGHSPVKGYLWYVDAGRVEEVQDESHSDSDIL